MVRVDSITLRNLEEGDLIQRMRPMIQFCSNSQTKFEQLNKIILSLKKEDGLLIYVSYYETLEFLESRLGKYVHCDNGGIKAVVSLSGKITTKNVNKKVASLTGREIVHYNSGLF